MLDCPAWPTLLTDTFAGSKNSAMGVPQPAVGLPFLPLPGRFPGDSPPENFEVESPQTKMVGLPPAGAVVGASAAKADRTARNATIISQASDILIEFSAGQA